MRSNILAGAALAIMMAFAGQAIAAPATAEKPAATQHVEKHHAKHHAKHHSKHHAKHHAKATKTEKHEATDKK